MPQIGHGSALFDDTPVNGEIEKGITSNWAYDEDAALKALIANAYPWLININPYLTPKAHLNMGTISLSIAIVNQATIGQAGNLNDFISWDVFLPAGTWTLELMFSKNVNTSIITAQIDGVSKGTIDTYAGTGESNAIDSITGIVITTSGLKELKLIILSKNDSSSNYYTYLNGIVLKRTA